ncbi:30S ribosomal protein S16 [Microgenomates group bacterium]|nr:30S ribosomal protein S16 [Microgenomates group bacterium]
MLRIKLTRLGKKKEPRYRIVVNEARDKRDGSYVAQVGIYQPTNNPKVLEFRKEAYLEWIKKGAKPTETVLKLWERWESGSPFPEKKGRPSKKSLEKEKAAKEAAKKETVEAKEEVEKQEKKVKEDTEEIKEEGEKTGGESKEHIISV